MKNIIKKIETDRLKKKFLRYSIIPYPLIFVGNFLILWYLTRDRVKGYMIFQFFKGLCINTHNKGLNSKFILRNVLKKTIIEKDVFFWSINNVFITKKSNTYQFCRSNNLFYLRDKQRKKSRFIIK